MLKNTRLKLAPEDPALVQQGKKYEPALLAALEASGLGGDSEWLVWLQNVCSCSPFIAGTIGKNTETLRGLISSGELVHSSSQSYFEIRMPHHDLIEAMSEDEFMSMLRGYRQREMARIGIRDLLGWADVEETLSDLSHLADICIRAALHKASSELRQLHGDALDRNGLVQELIVMGMGKLGGYELNYSSDIDLIFFYSSNGETCVSQETQRAIENERYFIRIGQRVIKYLNDVTEDGFVFRVDMRLRPYGDSGALVMSFDAAEIYYQSQGRDWERYALIKSRAVSGQVKHVEELSRILNPFIYRRYLDYGAFEALREMKAKFVKELTQKRLDGNVKLGAGGIREIEFIAQAFQIIRGGREAVFQRREILTILAQLGERNVIDAGKSRVLIQAYRFLRMVENRLQMVSDQQVHKLPSLPLEQARIAYAMGYGDWQSFVAELNETMQYVHQCFMEIFADPDKKTDTKRNDILGDIWSNPNKPGTYERIKTYGFSDPGFIHTELIGLRNSHMFRKMSASGRDRLKRLMPVLLELIAKQNLDSQTVSRLLHFIRTVARRSVYLALLVEYPPVLNELSKLFSASSWLADYLTQHPVLLDSLITQRSRGVKTKADLRQELHESLSGNAPSDLETQWDQLRQFKNEQVLWVATADIDSMLPLMKVSDHLTNLAEVILEQACKIATQEMENRYGRHQPGLAVIGYGKLGGIELGYGSDLDVIFLYQERSEHQIKQPSSCAAESLDKASYFLRVARKIVQIITSHTTNGLLYEMDLRLRPDGEAGLMVHTFDGFARYQREKAWTWEHQALVRARLIVGDTGTEQAFSQLRQEILCLPRDTASLKSEILKMRERMRSELSKSQKQEFDLKQDKGGIVDIEFMVQYTVLANASDKPQISQYTDNIRILESCSEAGILAQEVVDFLIKTYRQLRAQVHRLSLLNQSAVIQNIQAVKGDIKGVAEIWDNMFEVNPDKEAL